MKLFGMALRNNASSPSSESSQKRLPPWPLTYPLTLPAGQTEDGLMAYLTGFRLDDSPASELNNYLREDFRRFLYTLSLVPDAPPGAHLLEIGANPYFMSLLLRRFTAYRLHFTNFFGVNSGNGTQIHRSHLSGETIEFDYVNFNVDADSLPFKHKFQVVLFCEVLEHLINDPLEALLRIKAAMEQNGVLILTTPNVARLENVARICVGTNIYDPYSGYGPYGRHNREYSRHEIYHLLKHCGFEIDVMFSSDVHENRCDGYITRDRLVSVLSYIPNREFDLGQYLFVRARNVAPPVKGRPRWLFRSFREDELSSE